MQLGRFFRLWGMSINTVAFLLYHHYLADILQILTICIIKGVQLLAVNIEDSRDFPDFSKQRHYDLRTRKTAAGDMARKLLYIRNDNRLTLFPR